MLENRLDQDLKKALLDRDSLRVSTLRGLKSVILYAKVAAGTRDQVMPDETLIPLLQKEARKRQESADLYQHGGNREKAEAELTEKRIVEEYLPKLLSEAEVAQLVDEVIGELGVSGLASMGQVIGGVKQRTAGAADGAVIARLAKEKLSS